MAAVDYFLKIDGIDGESHATEHKDEINVESFSWGVTQLGTSAWEHTGAFVSGKVTMTDFHFQMPLNKASPKLFLACASGQHIKQATFIGETSDFEGGSRQFLKYTFSDILISSYQESGAANGVMDASALNFANVKTEATPGTRIEVTPAVFGNLTLDQKTGQVIVTESTSDLLVSGPSTGREGGSSFNRGVVEYALTDLVGVINGPDPCALMLDIREVRQPSEISGGEPPEEIVEGRGSAPGPVKKLSRHDVYWYGPTDLLLAPDDYSRVAFLLGSLQADPSVEPAEMSFDLCEVVKKHGLESIGIRIQSAMDHTRLMEEEGDNPPPEPDSGPPFIINPATFSLDLTLEIN
jgi:type VI secretion system secreted protein Hcp